MQAADNLLVEIGFAAVTIEGIAARAGVGKQTIYRWWPSKTDILLDAFIDDALQYLTPEDSGDLGNDLRRHLRKLAKFLSQSDAGAVFRALAGQTQHDAALASRFRSDYLNRQRAIARGDIPATTDIESALDRLLGPIYYRVLVTGEPVGRQFTDALVNLFIAQAALTMKPPR